MEWLVEAAVYIIFAGPALALLISLATMAIYILVGFDRGRQSKR